MSARVRRCPAVDPRAIDKATDDRIIRASFTPPTPLVEMDLPTLGLLAGLQCVGRAAAAVAGDRTIVGMNELVLPLAGHLIQVHEGRLAGRSSGVDERMRRLVGLALGLHETPRNEAPRNEAFRNEVPLNEAPRSAVAVLRPLGDIALIVRALPIPAGEGRLFRHARALVLFARAGGAFLPDPVALREAFGLTATEVEVALALAGGADARAIASERSISLATVRTHLKTIFAKTRTKRQAALVALILQLADVSPAG